eukprot:7028721-Prymnesium_polylepis.1
MGRTADEGEVSAYLQEATQGDRAGSRVMYGDFIEVMNNTNKALFKTNDTIFSEGDPPDGFHLILSGSVEVLQAGKVVARLDAGEYFGETALLSEAPRNATVRCPEPVETLRLSRDDFEAGFLTQAADVGVKEATLKQSLGFIQM